MAHNETDQNEITRRDLLGGGLRSLCLLGVGGTAGLLLGRGRAQNTVWQIDPYTCIACGNCATYCVMEESAVKCMHAFAMCGYCDLCSGFLELEHDQRNSGAENELCPPGAITRKFVEDPYYQYTIDEKLCNGCGKCVKGCNAFGNGSLFLQIRHDRCLNCNQCSIAAACPSQSVKRVPADQPYLIKEADPAE